MNILGVSAFYHDSAAALVGSAGIIAAAQEERFSRVKGDWRFPSDAADFCLKQLSIGENIDFLSFYENPSTKISRILEQAAVTAPTGIDIWPASIRSLALLGYSLPERLLELCEDPDRIRFVSHHRSHAASAFYPSPFNNAAVLVADGVGEKSTVSIWSGQGNSLTPIHEMQFPHSLGLLYSAFTQYCGFKVNSGEYKLMGLAPFGSPIYEQKILDNLIDLRSDGSFRLNMRYFGFQHSESTITADFEELFGAPSRKHDQEPDRHAMDIAASAQAVIERCMLRLAHTAIKLAGSGNLCLAGGLALNCTSNTRLVRELPNLDNIWIQPASGDSGGALGAALQTRASEAGAGFVRKTPNKKDAMKESLLGPSFSDEEIEASLEKNGLKYHRPISSAVFCDTVADALASGQVVGHFDGHEEFGPRALGNRSILADPRQDDALSCVNLKIKFRESWRPFAPIILEEEVSKYYENPTYSPYMLLLSNIKPAFKSNTTTLQKAREQGVKSATALQSAIKSEFPAVTHVNGSSRLQTIGADASSRARKILDVFFLKTGCPMLLNTSFNVRGEPIVGKPKDAIACFLNTDMDMLAIGPFIVRKCEQSELARNLVGKQIFNAD